MQISQVLRILQWKFAVFQTDFDQNVSEFDDFCWIVMNCDEIVMNCDKLEFMYTESADVLEREAEER